MAVNDPGRPRGTHRAAPAPGGTGRDARAPRDPVLRVDPIGCRAHGVCAELMPGYVTLDEWGYPILPPGPVPRELLAAARAAVRECPTLALRLGSE